MNPISSYVVLSSASNETIIFAQPAMNKYFQFHNWGSAKIFLSYDLDGGAGSKELSPGDYFDVNGIKSAWVNVATEEEHSSSLIEWQPRN